MINLTEQEQKICYALSHIFNTNASYAEILGDIKQDVANYQQHKELYFDKSYLRGKEQCFALFRVKQKYRKVAKEVLKTKSNFNQKDLEKLFYITASYCLKNRIDINEFDWAIEEGWDKNEFITGIKKAKKVSFLRKKYIDFMVGNHYKILCFMFGFTRYSFYEQKRLFKKHSSIHYFWWNLGIVVMFFVFFLAIASFSFLVILDFIINDRIVGFVIFTLCFIVWLFWIFRQPFTKNP